MYVNIVYVYIIMNIVLLCVYPCNIHFINMLEFIMSPYAGCVIVHCRAWLEN